MEIEIVIEIGKKFNGVLKIEIGMNSEMEIEIG